jgi:HEAT repeat protein
VNVVSEEETSVPSPSKTASEVADEVDIHDLSVEKLIAYLKVADIEGTRLFLMVLYSKGLEPMDVLPKCLNNPDPRVRMYAVANLGKIDSKEVVPFLLESLQDKEKGVRLSAAIGLAKRQDSRAVPTLIAFLDDDNENHRGWAAGYLGNLKDDRSLEPLIHCLKDSKRRVRGIAGLSLAKLKDPRAFEPLMKALLSETETDSDSDIKGMLCEALGNLGDSRAVQPIAEIIEKEEHYPSDSSVDALVMLGKDAVDSLLKMLTSKKKRPKHCAAYALGEIGDERAVQPLISALTSSDMYLRENAADALGRIGDSRAVEPLLRSIKDEEPKVRVASARSLGLIGDSRACAPLQDLLNGEEKEIRHAAASALGFLGDTTVERQLEEIWEDNPPKWAKVGIACGLVQIHNDREALEYLLIAVTADPVCICKDALMALAKICKHESVTPIVNALRQRSLSSAHKDAMATLGKITNLSFGNDKAAWLHWHETVWKPQEEKNKK